MSEFEGKRVVVMGLGRFGGGVGVTRYLSRNGANVLVTDRMSLEDLADPVAQLEGLPVEFRLGEHVEKDFKTADMIVVNPAVDPTRNLFLESARQHGAAITSELRLLVERLPNRGRTIGVTGTAGKSTTVAMIGHMLRGITPAPQRVWIGGNIGGSLLDDLDHIGRDDWVVLELSSFMLEMIGGWSPHVAVVTNVSPNHLDRHHTMDAYVRAKQLLLRHQKRDDRAVLGPGLDPWRHNTPATTVIEDEPIDIDLSIPGQHNRMNATLAIAACEGLGPDRERLAAELADFAGLPHRLQFVTEHQGVRYINDSKCTTPEAAMLAIDCFPPHTAHVILGGFDKGADLTELAKHAAAHCAGIYTIGATGDTIACEAEKCVRFRGDPCAVHRCVTLELALHHARLEAAQGHTILLSPGCASWDQFTNFETRGQAFCDLAESHPG